LMERKRRFRTLKIAPAVLFASLTASACVTLPPATLIPQSGCRSRPLAGVYYPWRLRVIAPCVTVSGTVEYVKVEPDHDWHVNLRLDPSEPRLTNWANRAYKGGDLVLEVVPMDQGRIHAPSIGDHITVTGAYVLDRIHGWREIHPVWKLNNEGGPEFSEASAKQSVDAGLHRK